jgi:hypothetical protein
MRPQIEPRYLLSNATKQERHIVTNFDDAEYPDCAGKLYLAYALALLLSTAVLAILIGYFLAERLGGHAWGLSYLAEDPSLRANDLTRLMAASAGFNPIEGVAKVLPGEPVPYPPAAFVYLGLLSKLPKTLAFTIFYLPCLFFLWIAGKIAIAASDKYSKRILWFVAIVLSYPVLYVLDRGNLDAYAALCCFVFFLGLSENRPLSAATILSLATALKLYPAALSILLLRREPKAFFLFVVLAIVETGFSLWILSESPLASFLELHHQLANSDFCYSKISLCLNLSAAVPFKIVVSSIVTSDWYPMFSGEVAKLYPLASIVIGLLAAAAVLFREAPLWRNALLLTTAMNLIPVMSYDYKLMLYFGPLLLLFRHRPRNDTTAGAVLLIAIMLSSFKWVSPMLHLWLHSGTQLVLFVLSLLPDHGPARERLKLDGSLMRAAPLLTAVVALMVVWHLAGPNLIRRSWAKSGWCPSSFAFDRSDPVALWGHGWGPFDGPIGHHWRWTTSDVATLYLPAKSGVITVSGVVALPPNSLGGEVTIFAAGLLKADISLGQGENKRFSFEVNTSPAASDTNTVPLEYRAPSLTVLADATLGVAVSDLRMTGSCSK